MQSCQGRNQIQSSNLQRSHRQLVQQPSLVAESQAAQWFLLTSCRRCPPRQPLRTCPQPLAASPSPASACASSHQPP
ncbi:hypothetical protein FGO68_gene1913 [Halteria grandinella]|uniref:Uncharacterized protein n=1 Tax=Halteria grandinella TaxID=5974 RepID=A0A8J8NAA3_HALGN|nr:hypothetical protein FGO68_gene1913 [Halteria grandinella]